MCRWLELEICVDALSLSSLVVVTLSLSPLFGTYFLFVNGDAPRSCVVSSKLGGSSGTVVVGGDLSFLFLCMCLDKIPKGQVYLKKITAEKRNPMWLKMMISMLSLLVCLHRLRNPQSHQPIPNIERYL